MGARQNAGWWEKHEALLYTVVYFLALIFAYALFDAFFPNPDIGLPKYLAERSTEFGSKALALSSLVSWVLAYPVIYASIKARAYRRSLGPLDRFMLFFLGSVLLSVVLLFLFLDFSGASHGRRSRILMGGGVLGFSLWMYVLSLVFSYGLTIFLHGFKRNAPGL